jgi:hypothetical protein
MELLSENDSNETNKKQKDDTIPNDNQSNVNKLNSDFENLSSNNNLNNFDTKCQSLSEAEPLICNVDYENLPVKDGNFNEFNNNIGNKKVPFLRKSNSTEEIKPCVQFVHNSFEFSSNENVDHPMENGKTQVGRDGNTNSSSSDDEDSSSESSERPPDGGYGWV